MGGPKPLWKNGAPTEGGPLQNNIPIESSLTFARRCHIVRPLNTFFTFPQRRCLSTTARSSKHQSGLKPVEGFMAERESTPDRGIKIKAAAPEAAGPLVKLFGHVTLVGEYALTVFNGCLRSRKHS